ncbi:DNA polymerase III subunit delta' [Haemophilus paracuniculus]|uniref:DNA polymerase III subunit delta' n=1 Tax=Haemophilus paracuniculus TaxID=734 RepID=A0A1T0ATB6_9PAST|nr:DNA polymerase III subunit delta' [Haemophilus paracuniculus]OOR99730.1 DNA polymerase III subunit delta' [Haemophilus paracuniculus]
MQISHGYPWHLATYQSLTDAFLQGRGHHALLFKTDVGLGTETFIRQFAHWLLCQNQHGREPCGECKSCHLWQSGNHPDFHLVAPIEGKDIGVDQVREITARLQQYSQQGGNAVVYLAGAERLTEAAANALLKTLEEPNANSYFLLEAPLQAAMMATIQSRCQTWLIQSPAPELALQWLANECPNVSEDDLRTALRLSHNRPLDSKNLLETDRLSQRKLFLRAFAKFYQSRDLLLFLTAFDKEKPQALQQLEWLASFLSDSLKAQMGISQGWTNADIETAINKFSQLLSAPKLLKAHQIVQQTQRDLLEINAVNQELMLADCLSKLLLDVFE